MGYTINHRWQDLKAGADFYTEPHLHLIEGLRQRINLTRVAAANHLSRFVRPADLDAFVKGFYSL
ncbi:MAG: hypothetical protein JRI95_05675 [Deltaproteobacteria bacterium]|nr:hypothetical protein [Deltaproteobacteria bacterium]MBW2085173.1 hypothetical protein [Deltaproteobacteria bacterium]